MYGSGDIMGVLEGEGPGLSSSAAKRLSNHKEVINLHSGSSWNENLRIHELAETYIKGKEKEVEDPDFQVVCPEKLVERLKRKKGSSVLDYASSRGYRSHKVDPKSTVESLKIADSIARQSEKVTSFTSDYRKERIEKLGKKVLEDRNHLVHGYPSEKDMYVRRLKEKIKTKVQCTFYDLSSY